MSTRGQSKTVSFEWQLSQKQTELFESDARFRVGMMGRRFGKNEVGSACIIDYVTRPESYDFGADSDPICWWVGPTYRQAYLYGFLKVKEKIPDPLIDEDDTRGSEWGPSKITLWDGRVIEFLSYGNPSGLQGAGVDLIVGDEWAYSDESLWHNDLRPMLMDSGGGAVLISKPLGENHFFEFFQQGESEQFPEWQSFHATAYDNPFIPDSEVDKAKKSTPEGVFRQEYLADPHAGGTLLTLDMLEYEDWSVITDRLERVNSDGEVVERDMGKVWNWTVAVDVGVTTDKTKARETDSDFWACAVVASHPQEQTAYLVQVLRERGQTPAQAAEWLSMVMSQVPTNKAYIEAVQAQEWFLDEAKDVGIHAIPVDHTRPKEERLTFLSVPFSNGRVKLIDWEDHPENNFDWSDFRTEWAGFPNGNHDDQLDAVQMALEKVNFGGGNSIFSANPYGEDEDER